MIQANQPLFLLNTSAIQTANNISGLPFGETICPCLTQDQLPPPSWDQLPDETVAIFVKPNANLSTYGYGCQAHDAVALSKCSNCGSNNRCPAWCTRQWCWIDPDNCALLKKLYTPFPDDGHYASYSTCRMMDSFADEDRMDYLKGKTLQIGFTANSGGWEGAYSKTGKSFDGPLDAWRGPCVDFVKETASLVGFDIMVAEKPTFLSNKSIDYFGTTSPFSLCVYAASLGVIDMCVGEYSVTATRALGTNFFVLTQQEVHLVVLDGYVNDRFMVQNALRTMLQPFKTSTWLFCVFLVIPMMALLFLVHEYSVQGSVFPKTEILLEMDSNGQEKRSKRDIPLYKHAFWSYFTAVLSVFQIGNRQRVVSLGGKIHLLGFAYCVINIVAAYKANLSSLLTERAYEHGYDSMHQVIEQRLRICAGRTEIKPILQQYTRLSERSFVVDPIEEGGDGLPGFDCGNCAGRSRSLDFLDPDKARVDSRYCHVALALKQDLELHQSSGRHCNKTAVVSVTMIDTGFPLFDGTSKALISALTKAKNLGLYHDTLKKSRQSLGNKCPVKQFQDLSLDPGELLGIWLGSAIFVAAGLSLYFILTAKRRILKASSLGAHRKRKVYTHSQYGVKMNRFHHDEVEWLAKNKERIAFDSYTKTFHLDFNKNLSNVDQHSTRNEFADGVYNGVEDTATSCRKRLRFSDSHRIEQL